jgi:hypothetical protein
MRFYECLTPDSKVIWNAIMDAFDCTMYIDKQLPIEARGVLENISEIESLMTVVPGFDRSDE